MENKILDIFILEDSPERIKWFQKTFCDCNLLFTKHVEEACNELRTKDYDIIFLDRDLGEDLPCGEELTKVMMEERIAKNSCIVIHTNNPWGRRCMRDHLKTYHDNFYEIEFTCLMNKRREDFQT